MTARDMKRYWKCIVLGLLLCLPAYPDKKKGLSEPLFGKAHAAYSVASSELKGAVFYLVSGHGGPDPGCIGRCNGKELHEVNAMLEQKAEQIAVKEDELVTKFIEENFDNILGPGVFFMMTASHPYPELSPWIEALMSKATDNFRNDPYVRDYYRKAQQNEAIMNGTATPGDAVTDMVPQANDVPTPNQLAQPAEGTNNK